MGIQDELQAEVDRIRASEAREQARLDSQDAYYREHLRPAMLRATAYFRELIDKLSVVEPSITVRYRLNPYQPDGVALKQSKYRLRVDSEENPKLVDVLCTCTLDRPREFFVANARMAESRSKILNDYGFPHHRKNKLDGFLNICGATFILEGPMTVRIRILADAEQRAVEIELRNFFDEPEARYHRFRPEQLDDDMLDRLAQLLLRKIPQLVETRVSDEVRDQLRTRLRVEQLTRERELESARRELAAEEEAARAARPINRLRGHLDTLAARGRALLSRAGRRGSSAARRG